MPLKIDLPEPQAQSTFRKTAYTRFPAGVTVRLRLLEEDIHHEYKHYIPKVRLSVVCTGEDCPVCLNNKKLSQENPDARWSEIQGIVPRSNRYSVNVLNRTAVKLTPTGNVVYPVNGQFPPVDPNTGELVHNIEPRPLNRVEVLEKGVEFFTDLQTFDSTVTDAEGNPIGITNYDIMVTPDKNRRPVVTPQVMMNDDVSALVTEELYDLDDVHIKLDAEEILKLLKGISLKDIYSARRVDKIVEEMEKDLGIDDDVSEDIKDKVANLLSDEPF